MGKLKEMLKRLYPNYKKDILYYVMKIDKILSPSKVKEDMKKQGIEESEYKDDLTGENLVQNFFKDTKNQVGKLGDSNRYAVCTTDPTINKIAKRLLIVQPAIRSKIADVCKKFAKNYRNDQFTGFIGSIRQNFINGTNYNQIKANAKVYLDLVRNKITWHDCFSFFIAGIFAVYAEENESVTKLDDQFLEETAEKNYNKVEKGYMTLYYNGKQRIWDRGKQEEDYIQQYCEPKKRAKLMALEPMKPYEKALAILEGARGGDLTAAIEQIGGAITYSSGVQKPETQDELIEYIQSQGERLNINISVLKDVERWGIYAYRKINTRRGDSDHGVKHAVHAVNHVSEIGEFINSHSKWFGFKVTENEMELAKYASLFHDAGRKNHMIDVFDETSAHRAQKQLGTRLTPKQLAQVVEAIKKKDDPVSNKSHVAILLHESDCIEIQRVRSNFDAQYMDLFKIYQLRHRQASEAEKTEVLQALSKLAGSTYVGELVKDVLKTTKRRPYYLLNNFYDQDIRNFNEVVRHGNSCVVLPNMVTLKNIYRNAFIVSMEVEKFIKNALRSRSWTLISDIASYNLNKESNLSDYLSKVKAECDKFSYIVNFSGSNILQNNCVIPLGVDNAAVHNFLLLPPVGETAAYYHKMNPQNYEYVWQNLGFIINNNSNKSIIQGQHVNKLQFGQVYNQIGDYMNAVVQQLYRM